MTLPPLDVIGKDEAHARRLKFQQSIAQRAADLEAAKNPPPAGAPATEAAAQAAAEPVCPPTLADLIAFRDELEAKLSQVKGAVDEMLPGRPSVRVIQKIVAKYYDVQVSDMCSARRTYHIVRPRHVAFYLCKELTPLSLPQIGRLFGGRDHTTALHAVRKIAELMPRDAELALDVVTLFELITGVAQ